MQTALDAYIGSFYKSDDSAAGAYARNGALVVVISSEKPNLRSYWAGRWTSTWSVKWGSTVEVTGEIKIQAHYFEDGNIQLHTNRPITQTASLPAAGSEADVAKAIVKHIEVCISVYIHLTLYNFIIYIYLCLLLFILFQSVETATRAGLDEMYGTLNTDTLKAMRRTLPITRNKMEWNVNAVRMNKQTRAAANNSR